MKLTFKNSLLFTCCHHSFMHNGKRLLIFALCLFAFGQLQAQKKETPAMARAKHLQRLLATQTAEVEGVIKDSRNMPIKGAQAFVYEGDTAIVASGFTDAEGYYETNALKPGSFNIKIVYPNDKIIVLKGVPVKKGFTPINLKADPPAADTAISYSDIAPKPEPKKPGNRSAKKK